MDITTVIIKPYFTEKSIQDAKNGKFTFLVQVNADKPLIKRAVETRFDVKVVDIATSIVKGRSKRAGTRRTEIALPAFKKATVKLVSGQKIDMFDMKGEETRSVSSG